MALNFRKGVEAIKQAQENTGGGFAPWAPSIRWSEDKEEKYVLFLTPIEDVPLVDYYQFIPLGKADKADGSGTYEKYGFYISPKDQAIGEDFDPLEELGFKSAQRNIAVAVELEPKMVKKGNRQRPEGFTVKTTTFERKGDDDQKEEVTAPVIGLVIQAPSNFFGYLGSHEESEGAVTETAFKVKRRGTDKNTEYDFTPYFDQEVDLSGLIDNLDGISYLYEELDEIIEAIEDKDEVEQAQIIADYLHTARLEELADMEQLQEDLENADPDSLKPKYGNAKKKDKTSRPSRRSQRSSKDEEPEEDAEAGEVEEPKAKSGRGKPSAARKSKFDQMRERAESRRASTKAEEADNDE